MHDNNETATAATIIHNEKDLRIGCFVTIVRLGGVDEALDEVLNVILVCLIDTLPHFDLLP